MPAENAPRNVLLRKVAVMGYPMVGKSSCVLRFVQGMFPEAYDTTIEDSHRKVVNFNDRTYELQIIDTAGQQEYSLFPRSCSGDTDGYILVYAINNRKSYDMVQTIREKIIDNVGEVHIPMVLVGNKLDLQHTDRDVSTEEGKQLAKEWSSAFLETSAKENNQVEKIFMTMLHEIERARGNIVEKKKKSDCVVS